MTYPYDGIKSTISEYNVYIDYLKKQIEELQKENADLKEELYKYKEQESKVFVKNKKM